MKTAFGIFLHDLKRLLHSPFAMAVALGLIVLPSVCAWCSIAAMWNPYSHTDVADSPSGFVEEVAEEVLDTGNSKNLQTQSGLAGAAKDLENISTGLAGADSSIEQWRDSAKSAKDSLDALKKSVPNLQSAIDDGQKALSDVRTAAHKVSSAYASALAEGGSELSTLLDDLSKRIKKVVGEVEAKQSEISSAEQRIERTLQECSRLIEKLLEIDPNSSALADLREQNEKLQAELDSLRKASAAFGTAASEAGDASDALAADVAKVMKGMQSRDDEFNSEILPSLDTSLDSVALMMGSLKGALSSLEKQSGLTATLLDKADSVLQRTRDAIGQTSEALESVDDSLEAARSDLESIAGSEVMKRVSELADIDAKSNDSFMASPVSAKMTPVYPLNSYGSGTAPFYTNLAIWVGCLALIAVMRPKTDPELFPEMKPWQGYVGRLLLLVFMALLQGVIVTVGDMAIGVQAASPVALIVAGMATAFCFVTIVYAMVITLKHVGKALAVVFLVVQIPGASGMYPIQLMPDCFQAIHPWLPFTYGMGAMREAIGGFYGATYAQCLMWLLLCGLAALAIALIVRPRILNLNRLLDRELAHADLYVVEECGSSAAVGTDVVAGVVADQPVVGSLLQTDTGSAHALARTDAFSRRYTVVRQAAPLAVIILVACLVLVSALLGFDIDGKLTALAVFIAAVVAIFCACVAYEYMRDDVGEAAFAPHESEEGHDD